VEKATAADRLRNGIPLDTETMRQLLTCAEQLRVPVLADLEPSHV
jgi:hypothetical protein